MASGSIPDLDLAVFGSCRQTPTIGAPAALVISQIETKLASVGNQILFLAGPVADK